MSFRYCCCTRYCCGYRHCCYCCCNCVSSPRSSPSHGLAPPTTRAIQGAESKEISKQRIGLDAYKRDARLGGRKVTNTVIQVYLVSHLLLWQEMPPAPVDGQGPLPTSPKLKVAAPQAAKSVQPLATVYFQRCWLHQLYACFDASPSYVVSCIWQSSSSGSWRRIVFA